LWRNRQAIRIAWQPTLVAGVVAAVLLWMLPVSGEVSAPALLRAAHEQSVYAPFPARVLAVGVSRRDKVEKGAPLVDLDAPDLKVRAELARVAIASAQSELARTPASERQQERRGVLEQQLAQALASMQSVQEDAARLRLYAAHSGTVRDLQSDVVPGQWVNPRQLLLRVVSESEPLIEAYVGERQLDAVAPGQAVRFYPALPNTPVLDGVVIAVDRTPIKEISRAVLGSVHGGDILVTPGPNGTLVAHEAVFRVTVKPRTTRMPVTSAVRGTVRIEGGVRFVAENFFYRTLSVLIRESGF
jgi:putative peptide zinc metalloprotease protein